MKEIGVDYGNGPDITVINGYGFSSEESGRAMARAIQAMSQLGTNVGNIESLKRFEELTNNKKSGNHRNGTFDRQQAFGNIKNLKKQKGGI